MAAGFLVGSILPSTRIEQERLGPIGGQLKERATERIQEAVGSAGEAL